jgi:hypothetical protein
MNDAQLTLYFALSLGIGLLIGIIGMLAWFKRVWPRIKRNAEGQGPADVAGIAAMSLFFGAPGLLFFLAWSVPAIYFNHLLKQHWYCIEVVRHNINRGITQNHPDLKERCGYFDMNELFAGARGMP